MSKESFIGGDYIETTGGDTKVYGESIFNSSATNFLQNGATSGVFHGTNNPAPIISPNVKLKRFLIHFRRPSDYNGKYGFDWLREEYIFPIKMVTNDNDGTPVNAARPICKNVNKLKQEYLSGVKNSIVPYGIKYYPAWLSIFPNTTTREFAHGSNMHASGIDLDLQFDEIDTIISDGTEIILQSINPFVKISPSKISISDVIAAGKKSRNINGKTINYYKLKKIINIKCSGGAINQHEEIKVFAKLKDKISGIEEKKEVGKLMVYKNNIIPKAEIVVVNVITNTSQKASLRTDYQYLFKNQSFNQALIRAEVKVDTEFDINSLPKNDHDVINFKSNYINSASNIGTRKASNFRDELIALYDKYGKHKPSTGKIDSNANKKTYLFFSTIIAQDRTPVSIRTTQGICSLDQNNTWGNSYVIFGTALQHKSTILHEGAHSFSLTHVFQEGGSCPHIFYMGFTDNIMDYVNQTGVSVRNPFESNDKMNCFFKWQWDLMRNDRSLILNY